MKDGLEPSKVQGSDASIVLRYLVLFSDLVNSDKMRTPLYTAMAADQ